MVKGASIDELNEHFEIKKEIEVKHYSREELDKKMAEFRERKLRERGQTPKQRKEKEEKKPVAETKRFLKGGNMKDEKFIYKLKCLECNEQAEQTLTEWEFEQITALPHKLCGKGKVIAVDKKPLQESKPNTELSNIPFYNAKIDYNFNPCKGTCFFNKDSESYKNQWECPKTAEHVLACQNLIIYEQNKKIIENGITVGTGTGVRDFDTLFRSNQVVEVKYDDGTSVNVSIRDIRRLFVIRNCFSKQNKQNPDNFGVMQIKDEFDEVIGDEYLTDDIIVKHLKGEITIGVHQISPDKKIKWLCPDIDRDLVKKGTPEELADSIIDYSKSWYNITGHKEASGSLDSYHVWLCFEPTSMEHAHNFWLDFESKLRDAGVDVDGFEKVISVGGGKGYGAMIKLPFGIQNKERYGHKGGKSRMFENLSKIKPDKLPEEFKPGKLPKEPKYKK